MERESYINQRYWENGNTSESNGLALCSGHRLLNALTGQKTRDIRLAIWIVGPRKSCSELMTILMTGESW